MALPPHVEKFVAGALEETSKSGGIVQGVRKVLDFLQAEGLVYSQRIHCSAIGVHNMNRDGLGVSWADSHRLVSEISQLGFVPEECKPVCVELKSDDTVVRSFNHQLQEEAGGKLGDPSSTAWIRFASLSCSHTNFAMRIVSENVEHSDPDVTMGGRLTVDRLSAKDPGFAKAVREGLDWTVVSARVIDRFPELCGLIQGAGNASGQIARQEYDVQMIRKIHNMVKGKDVVSWEDIKQYILRTKPPNGSAAPRMFAFVVRFQGPLGEWLAETEAYCRSSSRQIPAAVYESLGQERKAVEQYPRLRHALLKALLTGPADKALTLQDVKKLLHGKMIDKAQMAEALIGEVAALLRPVASELKLKVMGDFSVKLAYHVCEKSFEYDEPQAIAYEAINQVNTSGRHADTLVYAWCPKEKTADAVMAAEPEEGSRLELLICKPFCFHGEQGG